MDTVADFYGYVITLADVQTFVMDWLAPALIGLLTTLSVDVSKVKKYVPDNLRPYVMRTLVAASCVVLNGVIRYATEGTFDFTTLSESFVSYLTAVTVYEHAVKKS